MFKSYDELMKHMEKVFGEANIILNYIENAYELGCNEGEVTGFKQAMSDEFEHMDMEDLPDDLIQEIESGAYDRGSDDGYHTGYDEGRQSGYDDGYSEGHSDGYDECKVELGVD